MLCAISGEVALEPVFSKTTGHVYEKRLIEKKLEDGTCPMTGNPMSESDLVPVQVNKAVKPRQLSTNSIPGLLTSMQNEWDELMLETFTLKQHLDRTRQELSQALYQHDASCRVIARLMRERDEARAELLQLQQSGIVPIAVSLKAAQSEASSAPMDVTSEDLSALWDTALAAIESKQKELMGTRKGRKAPETLRLKESFSNMAESKSFTPHKSDKPGVTCIAVKPDAEGSLLLSGGVDKDVVLTDRTSGRMLSKFVGHSKKVNAVSFHPDPSNSLCFSASADKTVKVWGADSQARLSLDCHTSEVTCLSMHPSGSYAASSCSDGSWYFLDLSAGACLKRSGGEDKMEGSSYKSCQFHPDGVLLATGSKAGEILIWDSRTQESAANFSEHTGAVGGLCFSENGYLLASACDDGSAKIWDLRKQSCLKTLEFPGSKDPITSVKFDLSGSYLALTGGEGSKEMQIKIVKGYTDLLQPGQLSHSKAITGVAWGRDASFLVSCSMDRTIKVFA